RRRFVLLHPERRSDAPGEPECSCRAISERAARIQGDALDMPRPGRPRLDVCEMVPCSLKRYIDAELTRQQLMHIVMLARRGAIERAPISCRRLKLRTRKSRCSVKWIDLPEARIEG